MRMMRTTRRAVALEGALTKKMKRIAMMKKRRRRTCLRL